MILDSASPVIFLLVLILITILARFYWSRRKLYSFASKLDGPSGLPLVGSALKFLCNNEDTLNVFLDLTTPYSSPSKLWIGPRLIVTVKDPSQLRTILQSSKITTKADFYRFLEPFLGQGLLTSADPLHKWHKKLLQPFFAQKMIDVYSYSFQKYAKQFVAKIESHVNGGEFDVVPYLHQNIFEGTMDLLLEDENIHFIDYTEVPKYMKRFYYLSFTRFKTFWYHLDCLYEKTQQFKEIMMMKNLANKMIDEIMNTTVTRVIQRVEGNQAVTETRPFSVLEQMVEMVLNDPKSLSVQHCADNLMTLVGASQDTTSTAIAFTLMMLGAYPRTQAKVVAELEEVLNGKESLDANDVVQLKYLEMCIKEAMRLFAVVPFIFREVTEEFALGDLMIPKGVTVAMSIYHVHRDPLHWEKPNEFYPEHFTPEAISKRHPYAYIPFSAGPRKCIAQTYSYTNLKIFVGTVLMNYEVESRYKVEDIKLTTDISIRPINGHFLKIRKRSF